MKTNDPHVSPYETITAGSLEEKVQSWMQSSDSAWSRIAKAKAILEGSIPASHYLEKELLLRRIQRALEALEGK